MNIESELASLCGQISQLRRDPTVEGLDMRRERLHQIRLIGATAAYFGGVPAMERLRDAADTVAGEKGLVTRIVRHVWAGIDQWAP